MELIKIDQPISKDLIVQEKIRLASLVEQGQLDALKVRTAIAMYEKIFEGDDKKKNGLKHLIADAAMTEFERYQGEKELSKGDCKITVGDVGVRWDYSNDEEWKGLDEAVKAATEVRKQREEFLKSIPQNKPLITVDEETGDVKKIYAPVRLGAPGLKFSFR